MRLTPQRLAVLDVLNRADDHPTAAEVYDRVRARVPGIGAATVYRALGRLVADGQARELDLGNASARYDANLARHDHVVCRACGRAVDVDAPLAVGVATRVAAETGFTLTDYNLSFRGFCRECAGRVARGREINNEGGGSLRPTE